MVSGHSFGSSAVSLACITSMCPVQRFPGGYSLRLAFGSFFYPHRAPPFTLPLTGSIGVGAHGWRARVCQPWGRDCLGAGCAKGGSPWTSRTPTSLGTGLGPRGVYYVSSVIGVGSLRRLLR